MATASTCYHLSGMEPQRLIVGHPQSRNDLELQNGEYGKDSVLKMKTKEVDETLAAEKMPSLLFLGHPRRINSLEKTAVHPKKIWSHASNSKPDGVISVEKEKKDHQKNRVENTVPHVTLFKRSSGDFVGSYKDIILKSPQRNLSLDNFKDNKINAFLHSGKCINLQKASNQPHLTNRDVEHIKNEQSTSSSPSESNAEIFLHRKESPSQCDASVPSLSPVIERAVDIVEMDRVTPDDAMVPTDLSYTCHKNLNSVSSSCTDTFGENVLGGNSSPNSLPNHCGHVINKELDNKYDTRTFSPTRVQGESNIHYSTSSCFLCEVCGESANGNFFGANVCLPCKSFFIRCTKNSESCILRQCSGQCNINKHLRNRCQFCRYQRCLMVGMTRKEKPESIHVQDGQELCRVCGDLSNGIHFGVFTCEGCKKFYRRGLKEHNTFVCKERGLCRITPRNRNSCRLCRYQKCISVGMSRTAIKMGRPRKLFSSWEFEGTPSDQAYSAYLSRNNYQVCRNTTQLSSHHDIEQFVSYRDSKIHSSFNRDLSPVNGQQCGQFCDPRDSYVSYNDETIEYDPSFGLPLNNFQSPQMREHLKAYLGQIGTWSKNSVHSHAGVNNLALRERLYCSKGNEKVRYGSLIKPGYECRNYNPIDCHRQYNESAKGSYVQNVSRGNEDRLHPHLIKDYDAVNKNKACYPDFSQMLMRQQDDFVGLGNFNSNVFCNTDGHCLDPSKDIGINQGARVRNFQSSSRGNIAKKDAQSHVHPIHRQDNQYLHSLSKRNCNYFTNVTNMAKQALPFYHSQRNLDTQGRLLNQGVPESSKVKQLLTLIKSETEAKFTGSAPQKLHPHRVKSMTSLSERGYELQQCQKSTASVSPSNSNLCKVNETEMILNMEANNVDETERKSQVILDVPIFDHKSHKFQPSSSTSKKRHDNDIKSESSHKLGIKRKLTVTEYDLIHETGKKCRMSPETSDVGGQLSESDSESSNKSWSPSSSPCNDSDAANITYDPYTNEENFQEINKLFASEEVLDDAKFKQFRYSPQEVGIFWQSLAKEFQRSEQDVPKWSEEFDSWLQHIKTAYIEQLQTCEEGLDFSSEIESDEEASPCGDHDMDLWRKLQERIARQTFAETRFVLDLARVGGFLPNDVAKLTLNSSLFGNTILMASREWFDSGTGRFRFFWNWNLPSNHLLGPFQKEIICLGKRISDIDMDVSEVALLSALNISNPFNVELYKNEQCLQYTKILLALLTTHLQSKDVCPEKRIPELLSMMAPLRHMSMWFSNLIKNMKADPTSLDKTLYELSNMAVRASAAETKLKERSVWRIPG